MSVDVLNAITGDLVASNIIAATNHNYHFGATVNHWLDLFGYPAGAFVVKSTIVLPLKLFAGEFEKDALIHTISVSATVTNMKQGSAFNSTDVVIQLCL